MEQNSNNISNEKQNNSNHDEFDKQYEDFIPTREIPETVDRRAPQFNGANNGCHCRCPCARGGADGNEAAQDASTPMDANSNMNEDAESDTSSNYGDDAAKHDEGAEEHLIEVGDFGYIPIDLIHRTLARHRRCTCHHGILPGEDDYPFTTYNSPTASGFLTPGDSSSMIVEATSSGSDQSMASSQVLSICSRGSSLLEFMEGAFAQVPIFRPLSLTPVTYPIEINLSESEFSEFDLW